MLKVKDSCTNFVFLRGRLRNLVKSQVSGKVTYDGHLFLNNRSYVLVVFHGDRCDALKNNKDIWISGRVAVSSGDVYFETDIFGLDIDN